MKPSRLRGAIEAPTSKSWAQRFIALACLAEGTTRIRRLSLSGDVEAALNAARALGARVEVKAGEALIESKGTVVHAQSRAWLGGSGTSLRIFTAVACLAPYGQRMLLDCNEQLARRPIKGLVEALGQLGALAVCLGPEERPPVIAFGGGVRGGSCSVEGGVSSQYVSALIIACQRAEEDTVIIWDEPVSQSYVEITLNAVKLFNGTAQASEDYRLVRVKPSPLAPADVEVPGDHTLAAFICAAAAASRSKVTVKGLPSPAESPEARPFYELAVALGARIESSEEGVTYDYSEPAQGVEACIDVESSPDMALPAAALAIATQSKVTIRGTRHLAYKESNRVQTITETAESFGCRAYAKEDAIVIDARSAKLKPAIVDPRGDHRVAMMAAAVGLLVGCKVLDAGCVEKSWPGFWEALKQLGAQVTLS